jgi:hypothetical protein
VTLALERLHVPDPWVFFSAALAIVPIASLIVRSTEHLSTYTGDAVGGLLNASFGNAPELIIALVALRAGLLDMVRAPRSSARSSPTCSSRWASPSSSAACATARRPTTPRRRACMAR